MSFYQNNAEHAINKYRYVNTIVAWAITKPGKNKYSRFCTNLKYLHTMAKELGVEKFFGRTNLHEFIRYLRGEPSGRKPTLEQEEKLFEVANVVFSHNFGRHSIKYNSIMNSEFLWPNFRVRNVALSGIVSLIRDHLSFLEVSPEMTEAIMHTKSESYVEYMTNAELITRTEPPVSFVKNLSELILIAPALVMLMTPDERKWLQRITFGIPMDKRFVVYPQPIREEIEVFCAMKNKRRAGFINDNGHSCAKTWDADDLLNYYKAIKSKLDNDFSWLTQVPMSILEVNDLQYHGLFPVLKDGYGCSFVIPRTASMYPVTGIKEYDTVDVDILTNISFDFSSSNLLFG